MDNLFWTTDCEFLFKYTFRSQDIITENELIYLIRNRVVENMRLLDRMKDEYADVEIPLAVLE